MQVLLGVLARLPSCRWSNGIVLRYQPSPVAQIVEHSSDKAEVAGAIPVGATMDKVAVVGGRDFTDQSRMFYILDKYNEKHGISHIITGGARGADTLAESYAKSRCIPYTVYPANWDKHGKQAGFLRNTDIVKASDVVIAFPTKSSKGTWDSVAKADTFYKKVYVFEELDK